MTIPKTSLPEKDRSVGDQVLVGTLWIGAWRWMARVIGFASIVIIARLLLPEDFGIVASALLIVMFFDIMIELGTDSYLIRLESPNRKDYDTAWTLRVLVVSAAALVMFFGAGFLANFFGDERLLPVIQVLSAASLLRGFTNIGLTMYRRELRFSFIAAYGIGQRLSGFVATVTLAFLWENYWAVIVGECVVSITGVVLSYFLHSYRPSFCLLEVKKQWKFCKWIVVRNTAMFLNGRADQFVIAKYFGMDLVGFYAMAVRFAEFPTRHLLAPMFMPVYSGLSKKQGDDSAFSRSVLQVIGATCVVLLPAVMMIGLLREELVLAILGDNWVTAIPLIVPVVTALAAIVLAEASVNVLTLIGRIRLLAVLQWGSAICVALGMVLAAQWNDLAVVAWVRALLAGVFVLICYGFLWRDLSQPITSLLGSFCRPAIASMAMAVVLIGIKSLSLDPWGTLIAGGMAALVTYLVVLYVIWRLSGSPKSGEAMLAGRLVKLTGNGIKSMKRRFA